MAGNDDRERFSSREHWLKWEHLGPGKNVITGCACGFEADIEEDCGYGDSVVDHIAEVAQAAVRGQVAAAKAAALVEQQRLKTDLAQARAEVRQLRLERRIDEVRDMEPRCARWPEMCSAEDCVACDRIADEYERLHPVGAALVAPTNEEPTTDTCENCETYHCPTSGETECLQHGGFDVCCDNPACPAFPTNTEDAVAKALFEAQHEGWKWEDLQPDALWEDKLKRIDALSLARIALAATRLGTEND